MKKILGILVLIVILSQSVEARHIYSEATYQRKWCDAHSGIREYKLNDDTRVDCLTNTQAVEFDFAPKWAECIGQSLHYGLKTHRQPVCVLIMENGDKDLKYLRRLRNVGYKKGISTYTMKPQNICNPAVRFDCPEMK